MTFFAIVSVVLVHYFFNVKNVVSGYDIPDSETRYVHPCVEIQKVTKNGVEMEGVVVTCSVSMGEVLVKEYPTAVIDMSSKNRAAKIIKSMRYLKKYYPEYVNLLAINEIFAKNDQKHLLTDKFLTNADDIGNYKYLFAMNGKINLGYPHTVMKYQIPRTIDCPDDTNSKNDIHSIMHPALRYEDAQDRLMSQMGKSYYCSNRFNSNDRIVGWICIYMG